MAAIGCDLNRSTQHTILLVKRRSGADETKTSELLLRCPQGPDVGSQSVVKKRLLHVQPEAFVETMLQRRPPAPG